MNFIGTLFRVWIEVNSNCGGWNAQLSSRLRDKLNNGGVTFAPMDIAAVKKIRQQVNASLSCF
jgi:hypothetical protein